MLGNIQYSMEMQRRFTADVSHEIRSPLTSLRGSIEVSLRKKRAPEEYEELLKDNLSDVIRLSKITDSLLFLTRADNNILELRRRWFDLGHMLKGLTERMRYKAFCAGISISESYGEKIEINGDIDLLEEAFTNLIDNAINYTPSGGTITIASKKEDETTLISVSDTGIGIPEDEVPHVFERFYRVSKERSRKSGGTGLGLSIVKWIINAHSGNIEVKSAVGIGSEFIVSFPAH